jgi:hypothetical protein
MGEVDRHIGLVEEIWVGVCCYAIRRGYNKVKKKGCRRGVNTDFAQFAYTYLHR